MQWLQAIPKTARHLAIACKIANARFQAARFWKRDLPCWLQSTVRAAENPRTLADFRVVIFCGFPENTHRKDPFIQVTASSFAAGFVALLDLCVGALYCAKLIRKEAYPRIATWLIFEIGVVMSLAAYFASHDHSIVTAALNVTDGIVVTVILGSLLVRQRGRKILFTRNEQLCLVISCIALAAWIITKTAWVGFVGFQVVMSIAYFPTLESVWQWKPGRSPEPVETWSINAIAALIGVIIDITGSRDYLAMLYPLRAFILCVIIVALVVRWERKTKTNHHLLIR